MDRAAPAPPRLRLRRWQLPAALVLWVAALAVGVQAFVVSLRRSLPDRLVDLHVYTTAVSSFVHRGSLYGLHGSLRAGFTYPPFAGLVFLPLAYVPEQAGRIAWTAFTMLAVAAIALVVVRALPRRLGPVAVVWPALTALLVASKPLQSNLRFGQVSVFLTLGIVIDVIVLDGRRWQGVLTGLCAAIKLTPLVFVPYLWLTGRRRAAALAAGCFGLATAAGFAILPHDSAAFWTRYLWRESQGLPLAEGGNQSIYAVLLRAGMHGARLEILWLGLAAAVGVVGVWRAQRARAAGQPLLGLATVGCVSILVSPISWTHHQTWILLAAAGVFTANPSLDVAIASALVLPMLIGLPGVSFFGPVGRWLAANSRAVLAAAIASALPFRKPVEQRPRVEELARIDH